MKRLVSLCVLVLIYDKFTVAEKGEPAQAKKAAVQKKNITNSATAAPAATQVLTTTRRPLLPGFKLPCSCLEGQCGCCTGVILDQFNQKACLNITYEPDDFSLTAMMSMNGRQLYKRTVSGKNPPPVCMRVPRLQFIRLCVEFSNIYFASRNVHLCIDMEANWEDLTLLEWSFDCVRMGAAGVAVIGPEEGGGLPASPVDAVDQTDEDYDDSARNVPLQYRKHVTAHPTNVIFDQNLKSLDPKNIDKNLLKVTQLDTGDFLIAYQKK